MTETPDITAFEPSRAEWEARRARLVGELRAAPAPGPRRRRRRAVAAFAVTAAAGVGAAELLRADDVNVPAGIGCYDAPDLSANTAVIPAAPDPVAACAALWRNGDMGDGSPMSVPSLFACTGKGEPIRVMPAASGAVCRRLGLALVPEGYAAIARLQAAARAAVEPLMPRCEANPDIARAARGALPGWRVAVASERPDTECWAEIDARRRTVTIYVARR